MCKIEFLSIDIETYSSVDLGKCGVYKYAESPDAEVLLFAYSINAGPVIVIDVASGEPIPDEVLQALVDDTVIKWAFNASFERVFLSIWLKRNYPELFCTYSIPEDSVGNYLDLLCKIDVIRVVIGDLYIESIRSFFENGAHWLTIDSIADLEVLILCSVYTSFSDSFVYSCL